MRLFLSKEEQDLTMPFYSIGFPWMPENEWIDIVTAYYYNDCIEYYLFNKVMIWKKRLRDR